MELDRFLQQIDKHWIEIQTSIAVVCGHPYPSYARCRWRSPESVDSVSLKGGPSCYGKTTTNWRNNANTVVEFEEMLKIRQPFLVNSNDANCFLYQIRSSNVDDQVKTAPSDVF